MSDPTYDRTYSDVWNGLLDAARFTAYYSKLADRHRKWQKIRKFAQVIAGAAGTGTFLVQLQGFAVVAGAAILGSLAIEYLFGEKAALLDAVVGDCQQAEDEYRTLFERLRVREVEATAARYHHEVIRRQLASIARRVDVSTDDGINQQITEEIYDSEKARYATSAET